MESNIHWRYFLSIDEDFGKLSRFIEPCQDNLKTYSLEMARVLMAATQECDVVLRILCDRSGNSSCENEQGYRNYLLTCFPHISTVKVSCPQFKLDFTPFSSWQNNKTPAWWTGNNKVKHQRQSHYTEANLKNVMDAISGLLVSNIYLLKDEENKIWLSPEPKYFKPDLNSRTHRTMMLSQYDVPV